MQPKEYQSYAKEKWTRYESYKKQSYCNKKNSQKFIIWIHVILLEMVKNNTKNGVI